MRKAKGMYAGTVVRAVVPDTFGNYLLHPVIEYRMSEWTQPVRLRVWCHRGDRHCALTPAWAYAGHGPHDTSFSILAHIFGLVWAKRHEQWVRGDYTYSSRRRREDGERSTHLVGQFVRVVAQLGGDWAEDGQREGVHWRMSQVFVYEWLAQHGEEVPGV